MDADDEQEREGDIQVNDLTDRARWIQDLAQSEGAYESPIDINLTIAVPIELAPLVWHHEHLPCKKMKLTNSGHTLILSAKWHQERPFLSGGPFVGKYVFSQLHFHWGKNNMEGSEHTIDGAQQPLEMHCVHFRSRYLTQEAALREEDGIAVLVYLFKLQSQANPNIQTIVDALTFVQKPHCSARLSELPISFLLRKFDSDYYLYWGSVTTTVDNHLVLWLICREPIGISVAQVDRFRWLWDANDEPLIRNFRDTVPIGKRRLFHISPSGSKYSTLLPISQAAFKNEK